VAEIVRYEVERMGGLAVADLDAQHERVGPR